MQLSKMVRSYEVKAEIWVKHNHIVINFVKDPLKIKLIIDLLRLNKVRMTSISGVYAERAHIQKN